MVTASPRATVTLAAQCTAPTYGHNPGSQAALQCPSCGPRLAASKMRVPTLTAMALNSWGEIDVDIHSHTPYGEAETVERLTEGIALVTVGEHTLLRLSPERNRSIPTPFRRADRWYEEGGSALAIDAFLGHEMWGDLSDESREQAFERLAQAYPDKWQQFTGAEPAQPTVRRTGAPKSGRNATGSSPASWLPDGMLIETFTIDGQERDMLVPRSLMERVWAEGDAVLEDFDPNDYLDMTPLRQVPDGPARYPFNNFDLEGISERLRTVNGGGDAGFDLNYVPDGFDATLGQLVADLGISHRSRVGNASAQQYVLHLGDGTKVPVPRQMYEALDHIDTKSPLERTRAEAERLRKQYLSKFRDDANPEDVALRDQMNEAADLHDRIRNYPSAGYAEREAKVSQVRLRAFRSHLAQVHGLDIDPSDDEGWARTEQRLGKDLYRPRAGA